jgi:hypothetical protein
MQNSESPNGLTEFDLRYHGWRVVWPRASAQIAGLLFASTSLFL